MIASRGRILPSITGRCANSLGLTRAALHRRGAGIKPAVVHIVRCTILWTLKERLFPSLIVKVSSW